MHASASWRTAERRSDEEYERPLVAHYRQLRRATAEQCWRVRAEQRRAARAQLHDAWAGPRLPWRLRLLVFVVDVQRTVLLRAELCSIGWLAERGALADWQARNEAARACERATPQTWRHAPRL